MMDKQIESQYKEVLLKSLDALLMGVTVLATVTGSGTLKSTDAQSNDQSPQKTAATGSNTTYKKRTQAYLDTGEERTVVETYQINHIGQWELVDVKIEDAPSC